MRTAPMLTPLSLVQIALLAACGPGSAEPVPAPDASIVATVRPAGVPLHQAAWSEPINLGPVVNSAGRELGAELSPDGLSLYFGSDRPGGTGGVDIWASRRDCPSCPWGVPIVLGPNVNSPEADGGPAFSQDGQLLFFSSARAGGHGGDDIWVSRRTNTADDLGWEAPVNLGPAVNTAAHETGPEYFGRGTDGEHRTLYFVRGATLPEFDIHQISMTGDGIPVGAATAVVALNHPALTDGDPSIRVDGREMFFWSTRPGLGGTDIWVATRRTVRDAWSVPRNVGPAINTPGGDLAPSLSLDGRTLFFSAAATAVRPGSGLQDIWMSTRTGAR